MKKTFLTATFLLLGAAIASPAVAGTAENNLSKQQLVDRGRYLVKIAGCNDCHTPGYLLNNGTTKEAQWLTGSTLGWRGPWGTTYPPNLRLHLANLDEDQWLEMARSLQTRPPMPWFDVQEMTDSDLRAIGEYIHSMGKTGGPAPAYLPPDKEPSAPYVQFPASLK